MGNILIQLLLSKLIVFFDERLNKKALNLLLQMSFLIFILLISLICYTNTSETQNLDLWNENFYKIENVNTCKFSVNSFTSAFEKQSNYLTYELKRDSISLLPEFDNFKCIGKITRYETSDNSILIFVGTSSRLLTVFNIIFGAIFFYLLFNSKPSLFNLVYAFLYILFDYLLNIYIFNSSVNYEFLVTKLITMYLIYEVVIKKRKLNISLQNILVFIILYLTTQPFNMNLTPDDLYYLGYALRGDTPYTSFFGNSQWFLYESLIKFTYTVFGLSLKVFLELFLCVWLTGLIYFYSKFFKLSQKTHLLFPVLITMNQSFAAGDFFWGPPMPKVFFYLTTLTAIYLLLNGKAFYSNLLFAVAIYFHLAAFVIWLPFIAYVHLKYRKFDEVVKSSITVFLLSSPLLYLLITENFIDYGSKDLRYDNLEYLIKDYLPFHVYPFSYHASNILKINPSWYGNFRNIAIFIITVGIYSIFYNKKKSKLFSAIQFTTFVLIFYLIVNYISPINYFILLQPYKIISLLVILSVIFILKELEKLPEDSRFLTYLSILIFMSFSMLTYSHSEMGYKDTQNFTSNEELRDKIIEINPDVVLLPLYYQGSVQSDLHDLEVRTEIDTYVTYAFFPQSISVISEWQDRILNLEKFYSGRCEAFNFIDNYIFLDYSPNNKCGILIEKIDEIYLYSPKS